MWDCYSIKNKLNGKVFYGYIDSDKSLVDELLTGNRFIDLVVQNGGIENFEVEIFNTCCFEVDAAIACNSLIKRDGLWPRSYNVASYGKKKEKIEVPSPKEFKGTRLSAFKENADNFSLYSNFKAKETSSLSNFNPSKPSCPASGIPRPSPHSIAQGSVMGLSKMMGREPQIESKEEKPACQRRISDSQLWQLSNVYSPLLPLFQRKNDTPEELKRVKENYNLIITNLSSLDLRFHSLLLSHSDSRIAQGYLTNFITDQELQKLFSQAFCGEKDYPSLSTTLTRLISRGFISPQCFTLFKNGLPIHGMTFRYIIPKDPPEIHYFINTIAEVDTDVMRDLK